MEREATQEEITEKVFQYLRDAYNDRFNESNFPILADTIAEDLHISTETAAASGDILARQQKAERFEPAYGFPAAYRLVVPSSTNGHRGASAPIRKRHAKKSRRHA